MTALGLLMSGAGVVLIFAGIKGEDVRALVVDVLTGKRQLGGKDPGKPAGDPNGPGGAMGDAAGRNATGQAGDPNGPGGAMGDAAGRAATGASSYSPLSPSPVTAQLAAATASRGYSPTID